MREIKFRGKSIETGAWVDGDLVTDIHEACSIIDYANHKTDTYTWTDVDPKTVGQFTGLKDKNGKEIYEGDVLDLYLDCDTGAYYAKAIVTWNNEVGAWFIKWVKAYDESLEMLTEDFEDVESREVIGNIYENPELIS